MLRSSLPLLTAAITFFTASAGIAALQIPLNLTEDDRETAVKIIGLGTGAKILTDPYPMGGYSGFEFGVSIESLPTDDISRLGAGLPSPQQEVIYPKLTIGKGVYNDIDLFLHFTPFRQHDDLSSYGGMARWGFYQGRFLPVSASLLLHASNGNVTNLLTTRTYGFDLITGITVNQLSLFAGGGWAQSHGTFVGGANGVAGGFRETTRVSGLHTVVGANIRLFDTLFVAMQIDRAEVPVISGKLGVRF